MRRFLKYWMIRLLGRGFIILPLRCKLAGLWWSFSLMVICGYVEQQQQWPLLVITANFAGSTFAVMAVFKTRKYHGIISRVTQWTEHREMAGPGQVSKVVGSNPATGAQETTNGVF